jgi:hypothetical protein
MDQSPVRSGGLAPIQQDGAQQTGATGILNNLGLRKGNLPALGISDDECEAGPVAQASN